MPRYISLPTYAPAIYNLKAALRTGKLSRVDKKAPPSDSAETTETNGGLEGLGGLQIGPMKDEEYWFDDGSVILSTSTRLFCVHKSVLSCHSGLFNTLFTLPQPETSEEGEVMDGLPVVSLSDDSEDIKLLLNLCYDRRYVLFSRGFIVLIFIYQILQPHDMHIYFISNHPRYPPRH